MATSLVRRPTAIVTGALRGIGRACAVALSKSGFNVLLNDIAMDDEAALAGQLVAEIGESGAESILFAGDVANLGQHTKLMEAAIAEGIPSDAGIMRSITVFKLLGTP